MGQNPFLAIIPVVLPGLQMSISATKKNHNENALRVHERQFLPETLFEQLMIVTFFILAG